MSFPRKARLLRRVIGGIAVAAALVACGGGTSQYDPFEPGRLIVFGDENSLLNADGRRWNINFIDENGEGAADDEFNCAGNAIWVQRLASHYGFAFAECNPDDKEVRAFFRSTPEAKVAALPAQIAAQQEAGGFRSDDVTTVMIGAHDVLELYAANPAACDPEDLDSPAALRGRQVGEQVKVLVNRGARVLLSYVPDMGLTPFARAEQAAHGGNRQALLTCLTAAFNNGIDKGLLENDLIDGRFLGLVNSDTRVKLMDKSPGSFGIREEDAAACRANLGALDCSSQTLVDGANNSNHLWADAIHFGPTAHAEIADLAIDRAEDNPF